jgi:hypothetical protein
MNIDIKTSLIIAAIIGLIPAFIAKGKGYNFFTWWFYGFVLFIVALPFAIAIKRADKESSVTYYDSSKIIADLANLKAIKDTGALSEEEYKKREDALKKQLQNPYVDFNPNTKMKIRNNLSGVVSDIRLKEWSEMKSTDKHKDFTPIIIVVDKKIGNYQTLTISQWNDIKAKGLVDNFKIYEGTEIS